MSLILPKMLMSTPLQTHVYADRQISLTPDCDSFLTDVESENAQKENTLLFVFCELIGRKTGCCCRQPSNIHAPADTSPRRHPMTTLFTPIVVGGQPLKSRIVMAPMTRSRASTSGVPSEHAATYYAQRADAGLIITEGTQPSAAGQGYPRTPGIHTPDQIEAWAKVTHAVHEAGSRIFLQVMHVGRIAHPLNRTIADAPVAPSAIQPAGQMFTDQAGMMAYPTPRALELSEIQAVIEHFGRAAKNALAAGFDGVELHAANGYLPNQFLASNSNQRRDGYGGSVANRIRFTVEAIDAMIAATGSADRIGIRISPGVTLSDMHDADPIETHTALLQALAPRGLAYVHIMRAFDPHITDLPGVDVVSALRPHVQTKLIAAGDYNLDSANAALASGQLDLVGFGRPFIANPDLVSRFQMGRDLSAPDQNTLYSPGPAGYIDYPHAA
jgi:N-ethylmaleimide reductase